MYTACHLTAMSAHEQVDMLRLIALVVTSGGYGHTVYGSVSGSGSRFGDKDGGEASR